MIIELGRYNQTIRDKRFFCPLYGSNQKEEVHFLFLPDCSKYAVIRNNCYTIKSRLIPNVTQLLVYVLINKLMNSSNLNFISKLFFFLYKNIFIRISRLKFATF